MRGDQQATVSYITMHISQRLAPFRTYPIEIDVEGRVVPSFVTSQNRTQPIATRTVYYYSRRDCCCIAGVCGARVLCSSVAMMVLSKHRATCRTT